MNGSSLRLLPLAGLIAAAAAGSPAMAASDSQLWSNNTLNVKLSDRWRLSEELTVRFSDKRRGLYEVEVNSLVGHRFNNVVTLWAGYTHNPQYSAGKFTVMERRAREQVTFDKFAKLGGGTFNARLRLEQRWRDGIAGTGWRTRPFLRYSHPLRKGTAINLSSEPFINLNATSFQRQSGLDRVRNLVTVSTGITKTLSGEIGYLNQHGFVRGGRDTSDHVAYFGLSMNL